MCELKVGGPCAGPCVDLGIIYSVSGGCHSSGGYSKLYISRKSCCSRKRSMALQPDMILAARKNEERQRTHKPRQSNKERQRTHKRTHKHWKAYHKARTFIRNHTTKRRKKWLKRQQRATTWLAYMIRALAVFGPDEYLFRDVIGNIVWIWSI